MLLRRTRADSNLSMFQGDSSDKWQHLQQRKSETEGPKENDCIINNVSNS